MLFIFNYSLSIAVRVVSRSQSPTAKIVRTEFDGHFVAGTKDNSVSVHVSAGIDVDFVALVI